ncbi:MAG: TonB-dependent receptor [Bacteroidia bacterium]|nr:TonB-dependent receptor [Bacteroidia bacterium]
MQHRLLTYLFLVLVSGPAVYAQQTLRGTVTDKQTLMPLVGARVILTSTDPVMGALTNERGEFRLERVPAGRHTLQVTYLGYAPAIQPNLITNPAQELVLEIGMEEQITQTDAVEIVAETDKNSTLNELTTVSARTFSVEEALRYAGSRNDPARMAQNFAGVSGINDGRNDIVIRGNSPAGVLWRLEGIDIPNPNHFGALGATGGPVSMLNNNNLSDADFLTSAFPAEYGNALSGVFDLGLRNGNNEKHEVMGQIGFNGFEVGLEGPISRASRASYIANYRYSTLGVFKALGINFGTGAAVPEYQDLTFKINAPTSKAGRFVLFGMGGLSAINFLDSESDETNFFSGEGQDLYNKSQAGVIGLSHTYIFNPTTHGKLTLAASTGGFSTVIDSLSTLDGTPVRFFGDKSRQTRYSAHYQVNKKFSARNHLRLGVLADLHDLDLEDSVRIGDGSFRQLRAYEGQTGLAQAYAQWMHKFSDQVTLNTGAHYQIFALNRRQALEPRLGLKYQFSPKQSLNIGAGLHHQLQPLAVYFLETAQPDQTIALTNEDLNFTRSLHTVLGYDHQLGDFIRLKVETYYQWIDQAPVTSHPSSFSLLNFGADFGFPAEDSLVNTGTARNYGLELTLEKFFSRGYYFLMTGSLFEAQYEGSDGVTRDAAFNGNYILNVLGGKEFNLGPHTLSFNAKMTWAGSRRYTPIDLAASRLAGTTVLIEDQAYEGQFPGYFRADLKTTFRMNGKKLSQEWSVDLQNVTNQQNVFNQTFSRTSGEIETTYQIGLFPVIQYRILL